MSLFLNVSNILAVFNILKHVDENGFEIDPTMAWTTGATTLVHDTYDQRAVNLINIGPHQALEALPVSNSASFERTPPASRQLRS